MADIEVRLHARPELGVVDVVGRESGHREQRVGRELGDVEVGRIVEVHMNHRVAILHIHEGHLPAIGLIVHDAIGRHTTVHLNESALIGGANSSGADMFRGRNASSTNGDHRVGGDGQQADIVIGDVASNGDTVAQSIGSSDGRRRQHIDAGRRIVFLDHERSIVKGV